MIKLMAHCSWLVAHSKFSTQKVPLGTTEYRQVWRAELGMPANMTGLISKCCRHDRGFLSLFYRKKEKQKKLAAV